MLRAIRWVGGLKNTLVRLGRQSQDLSAPLREFGAYMLRSITKNFQAGGRRDGVSGAWPKLSEMTIALRPKGQRANPKILVRSARLRNSTTFAVGRNLLAVGTNLAYAPKHHQGGRWGGAIRVTEVRKIPAHRRWAWVRAGFHENPKRWMKKAGVARLHSTLVSRTETRVTHHTPSAPKPRQYGPRPDRPDVIRRQIIVRAHTEHRTRVIPARPIYGFQPEDHARWKKILAKWFRAQTTGKVA